MEIQLLQRGYPSHVIHKAKSRSALMDCKSSLAAKLEQLGGLTCKFRYSIAANDIKKLIYKHWHIVKHILGCQKPQLIGFRRPKHLFFS